MKIYTSELGHMTNMAAMPICSKNLTKNLLFQNQSTNDLETWYGALSVQALPRLSNYDPGLTLTYFTPRSSFGHIGFCMGKSENYSFLETISALGLKVD